MSTLALEPGAAAVAWETGFAPGAGLVMELAALRAAGTEEVKEIFTMTSLENRQFVDRRLRLGTRNRMEMGLSRAIVRVSAFAWATKRMRRNLTKYKIPKSTPTAMRVSTPAVVPRVDADAINITTPMIATTSNVTTAPLCMVVTSRKVLALLTMNCVYAL